MSRGLETVLRGEAAWRLESTQTTTRCRRHESRNYLHAAKARQPRTG